jgi:hypothetical protein
MIAGTQAIVRLFYYYIPFLHPLTSRTAVVNGVKRKKNIRHLARTYKYVKALTMQSGPRQLPRPLVKVENLVENDSIKTS